MSNTDRDHDQRYYSEHAAVTMRNVTLTMNNDTRVTMRTPSR